MQTILAGLFDLSVPENKMIGDKEVWLRRHKAWDGGKLLCGSKLFSSSSSV